MDFTNDAEIFVFFVLFGVGIYGLSGFAYIAKDTAAIFSRGGRLFALTSSGLRWVGPFPFTRKHQRLDLTPFEASIKVGVVLDHDTPAYPGEHYGLVADIHLLISAIPEMAVKIHSENIDVVQQLSDSLTPIGQRAMERYAETTSDSGFDVEAFEPDALTELKTHFQENIGYHIQKIWVENLRTIE